MGQEKGKAMIELRSGDRRAERDWHDGRIVSRAERNALVTELGDEPEGDWILVQEPVAEGSESNSDDDRWLLKRNS